MAWKQLEKARGIFEQALELTSEQRQRFLDSACSHDAFLRTQVERMLDEFDNNSTGITPPFVDPAGNPSSVTSDPDFCGTERFAVQKRIGSGAFGSVYQVWDRERQVRAALKLLHSRRPESLVRFKREFRSLVDLRHPNLIRLHELFCEDQRWFFTMELVDGEDFRTYLRPANSSCKLDLLRPALLQLVQGIHFLHKKCFHRDLKPGNVLITSAGRVVILDFGLVRERESALPEHNTSLVGTPRYMSPEQLAQMPITSATDWYSVGVMLFEVLTGRLPRSASFTQGQAGQQDECVEPRSIDPLVPEDLNKLCRLLLNPVPELRPDGETLLNLLGGAPVRVANVPADDPLPRHGFVGRAGQLDLMNQAFGDIQEGRLAGVLIEGRSGIGKSALVRQFLERLAKQHSDLLILIGHCYEFESVPYKAFDYLIDELSRFLQRLPDSVIQALLPRDAILLSTLFPVFARIREIAASPTRSIVVPDAQELRQRTFAALKELLARLADRYPIVVWIDDLHWGDRDSSLLLSDLCTPPQQPPLLWILTYRNEEFSSNANLQYLLKVLISTRSGPGPWHQIRLDSLSSEESRQLLRSLLPDNAGDALEAQILGEAAGHPLFLQELVRAASSQTGLRLDSAQPALELRAVLQKRVSELPAVAREVLEFICVAVQPLLLPILFRAVGLDDVNKQADSIGALVRDNLARILGTGKERKAEAFHDQVRSAVIEIMDPEARRARHAQLGAILAALPEIEPQTLVTHYREAGDVRAAHSAALMAAQAAENQLAFDRAAVLFETAISVINLDGGDTFKLYRKLAGSLAKAGRGRDSASAYLKAAQAGTEREAFDMHRLAADQLMRSGYIDEAMRLFRDLAKKVGILSVDNSLGAFAGIVRGRLLTRIRLLTRFPTPAEPAAGNELVRLEILRTAGIVLTTIDPGLAAYFQVEYVRAAIRVRDPIHLASALAVEASIRVALGTRNPRGAFDLLHYAEEIARATDDPNTVGFVHLCRAFVDCLLGRIPEGIKHSRRAVEFLREHCTGIAWELTSSYTLFFCFSCWAGNVLEIRKLLPQLLQEGAARGDVNMEAGLLLLGYGHYCYLAADKPDECIAEYNRALSRWSTTGFHRQHYGAMTLQVETALYVGAYADAREKLLATWNKMSRSLIAREQITSIMSSFLRGRVALACWMDNREDQGLYTEVEQYAKRLGNIRSDLAQPMAQALRAGVAAGLGRRGEALRLLTVAIEAFERAGLHAYAAAASYRSGALRNDSDGRAEMKAAWSFFATQDVRNPAAFIRMLLPGKWI